MKDTELQFERRTHTSYGQAEYSKHDKATFIFRQGTGDSLVIYFHGSIQAKPHRKTRTPLPVFYGLGRSIPSDPSTLHFSDHLLETYAKDELELAWFLNTRAHDQRRSIVEVVDYFRRRYKFAHILFHGSSGGGHISLIMASTFGETAVVANSQFSLEDHSQWKGLQVVLRKNNDRVNSHDLRLILSDLPGPKRVYDFCNVDDYTIDHHRPIMQWIEDRWPGRVEWRHFSGKEIALATNVRNHAVRFPDNRKVELVLGDVLEELSRVAAIARNTSDAVSP